MKSDFQTGHGFAGGSGRGWRWIGSTARVMGAPFPTDRARRRPEERRRRGRTERGATRRKVPEAGRDGRAAPAPAAGPPYRYLAAASTLSLSYTENGPMSTRRPFSRVGSLWMV